MKLRSPACVSALFCVGLLGCSKSEPADDCSTNDDNTPGSACINPIRFDFDADEVDIVGDLADEGIDFVTPEFGFQIETDGVRMSAGEDDEWCEAFAIPENPDNPDKEWCINQVDVALTRGYHHLFVSKAPIGSISEDLMVVGERVRCVGGAHVTYGSALLPIPLPQGAYVEATFWENVGIILKAGQKLSVNYHYINTSDDDIIATAKLNFHATECEGTIELGQFGYYNQAIAIPPGEKYTTSMCGTFSQDVYVLDIFRHTHRLGTDVPITFNHGERDGEIAFLSKDYELNAAYRFPEPIFMMEGEGFCIECNYDNPTDQWIRFGPTADDEMCMLLGTWWVANPGEEMEVQHRYKWEE